MLLLLLTSAFSLEGDAGDEAQKQRSEREEFSRKSREIVDEERALQKKRFDIRRSHLQAKGDPEAEKKLKEEEEAIQARLDELIKERRTLHGSMLHNHAPFPHPFGGAQDDEFRTKLRDLRDKERNLREKQRQLLNDLRVNPTNSAVRQEEEQIREEIDGVRAEQRKLYADALGDRKRLIQNPGKPGAEDQNREKPQ
jgi:hypothetical protein